MNSSFSFSKYSATAAACVWTLGWVLAATQAMDYLRTHGNGIAVFNLVIPVAAALFGAFSARRFFRAEDQGTTNKPKSSPPEPWYRRVFSWMVTLVWCVVALVWNVCVFHAAFQAGTKGQLLLMVVQLPFSLIGGFLLLFLFVGIGLFLDFIFQIKDRT